MRRFAGVLGWPIEHSRSPALHDAAFRAAGIDAVYGAFAVPEGALGAALEGVRALGFLGVNVTVPHKRAALAHCDEVDLVAERTGAVNTVVVTPERRLVGTNTDVEGFRRSLEDRLAALGPGGRKGRALVLGAGGAARAVVLALRDVGAEVVVIARNTDAGRALLDLGAVELFPWSSTALALELPRIDLLVDATSLGLDAAREASIPARIPIELAPEGTLVCSLVYHRETALLAAASARGLPTLDGAGMLVNQAAAAFTRMTGVPAPLDAMWGAMGRKTDGPRVPSTRGP